ncbi:MAG: hypothetical protein DDT20_01806 [Firmicutes bacterium]|nr:hypothetical protein [Bacillota bacterium]
MSVNPAPIGVKPQFELANGLPAVGNRLFFYVAGTTNTKQSTLTNSTGNFANPNPIVLNSLGQPPNEIWFTAGRNYKVVYAPPGADDPPSSPIWEVDNLAGINDVRGVLDQWVSGPAPTFVSATSFTLLGDQTSVFQVNRRLRTLNTSGTIHSTILTSAFVTVTTVTVVNDSGVLDTGLSAVSYGLLSPLNASYAGSTAQNFAARSLTLSGALNLAAGANIASAATVDLTAATGNSPRITGVIPTSAVTMNIGQWCLVVADGPWPLTYHLTTNRINSNGANITLAANDKVLYHRDLSGIVHGYIMKADGTAVTELRSRHIAASRDNTLANGPQDITGFGFSPTACHILSVKNGANEASWGYAAQDGSQGVTLVNGAVRAHGGGSTVVSWADGSNHNNGTVSFIADGIRITWAKVGVPVGVVNMHILGLR